MLINAGAGFRRDVASQWGRARVEGFSRDIWDRIKCGLCLQGLRATVPPTSSDATVIRARQTMGHQKSPKEGFYTRTASGPLSLSLPGSPMKDSSQTQTTWLRLKIPPGSGLATQRLFPSYPDGLPQVHLSAQTLPGGTSDAQGHLQPVHSRSGTGKSWPTLEHLGATTALISLSSLVGRDLHC